MKKNMKNTNKTLKIIAITLVSSFLLVVNSIPKDNSNIIETKISLTPKLNEVTFIEVPKGKTFKEIELISHESEKEVSKMPTYTFYTTETNHEITEQPQIVYTQPYHYDILKKGNKEVIRIYTPSIYYDGDNKITTTNISFNIVYDNDNTKTFTTAYQPQEDDCEYVIITNESFWQIINDYFKDWKISSDNKISNITIINVSTILNNSDYDVNGTYGDGNGTNSWVTDTPLSSNWEMFNDSQCHIRNYLRYCHDVLNTSYVLLFGNSQVVPPRMIASYAAGTCPGCTNFYNDTNHASDMYYSCLHYNMNNNTNSYWMENDCCNNDYDRIDWGYDLNVGRVLINQKWEAFWWINKTKSYVANNQSNYTQWAVVPCKDSGNSISNQTWTGWDGSELGPSIGDEFPSNISFINNQNITQAQWNQLANYANGNAGGLNGLVLIYHAGHGGTLWDPYSDSNLNNMHIPNFIYTEGCTSANFGEDTSSRMEDWMSDNGGAFGGISNSAYGWFVASTYYGEQMMREMFNDSNTSVFSEAHNRAREKIGHDPDCVWGMIVKETNFFGDPALEWEWYEVQVNTTPILISINGQGNSTTISDSTPTFNWTYINTSRKYNLLIASDSTFTTIILNLSNVSDAEFPSYYSTDETNVSFTLPEIYALQSFNTYYVKVKSYGRET